MRQYGGQKSIPASGKFVVRLPSDLHEHLVRMADEEGISLNRLVVSLLAEGAGYTLPHDDI